MLSNSELRSHSELSPAEKRDLLIESLAFFPSIVGSSSDKYEQVAKYWVEVHGVVCAGVRDIFTAGGKQDLTLPGLGRITLRQVEAKIYFLSKEIEEFIVKVPKSDLSKFWGEMAKVDFDSRTRSYSALLDGYSQSSGAEVSAGTIFALGCSSQR
jgi:hypothetical protein